MRLRYLLPALEVVVCLAFVFVPLWRYLPYYWPKEPDGTEIVCHDNCPPLPALFGIDPVTFAKGINLPTAPAVLLVLLAKWDYSHDGQNYFQDPVWQGVGFALSGMIVWFFVGRFFDDLILWRKTRVWPRIRILDLIFVHLTSAVATMQTIALLGLQRGQLSEVPLIASWSIFWILIGYSGITVRGFQLIQKKRGIGEASSLINQLP